MQKMGAFHCLLSPESLLINWRFTMMYITPIKN